AKGHLWARIEPSGQVRVGLDDFARKALGPLTSVTLPQAGKEVRQGDPLFTAERGGERLTFMSPVSGKVASVNGLLGTDPSPIHKSPYDKGWVLRLEPADLAAEIPGLRIGKPVVDWYQEEITRLREAAPNQEKLSGETLQKLFF
ncbi:MAG: glycine cleavage system protein H, partial [Firmicutes bacterium]|nr:glycine cleavage system protein H [Bacillota bacterium]